MLKIIVFFVLGSIVSYILNLFLGNLIAFNIVDFFGVEWGPTIYATIIFTLSAIIDYFVVFKVLFKDKGTETIIHDDPPAEEVKKEEIRKKIEVPAEVKEFKEDKFEEVSFLDEAKEVKPDERLVFVQDVKKNKNNDLKIFAFVVVFVWLVGLSIFVSYFYDNFTNQEYNNSSEVESSYDYSESDIKHLEFQLENARKKIDYLENEIYSLNERVRDLEPDYYNGY